MPYTLNGIGTHYYGARNRSAHVSTCGSCSRQTTLSSYDTREWFCIVFIPIIPLTKYRVLDDCSSCRRHQRLKLDEYNEQLEATRPLEEAVQRSPSDPKTHAELVRALIGFNRRDEASRVVAAALSRHANDLDLNVIAGQLAIDAADWNGALPYYEKAYSLEPQNAPVAYSYGWLLHQLGRNEQAIGPLQRAAAVESTRLVGLYVLGMAQLKLGRTQDALHALQQLLSLEPAYLGDKKLLRTIADCKKQLGYELTPAERSASRRWWPFGRKQKRPQLAAQPTLVRPGLRWAGIFVVVLMAFSLGYVAYDSKTNIPVYFDNALGQAVDIDLDGNRFSVAADRNVKQTVKEGRHTVIVSVGGKELERHSFDAKEDGIIDAMSDDRFFVYNVGTRRVYRRAIVGYAKNESDQSYSEDYIAGKRFFEQRNVDYPFSDAPTSISADSSSSNVKKVSFIAAPGVGVQHYAFYKLQQGKKKEAKEAMELAVSFDPCDAETRRMQIAFAGMTGTTADAGNAAKQWMSACAPDDLEAHRAYQDIHTVRGLSEQMRREYAAKVAAEPQSAKLHYLNGRVAADSATAIAEHRAALALDPSMVWPRVALAHQLALDGRYPDAMREFATAVDTEGRDPAVVTFYAAAAISNGTPADAVTKVEEVRKASKDDAASLEARYLLALAGSEWDVAAGMEKKLSKLEDASSAWWRKAKTLRMRGNHEALEQEIKKATLNEELRGSAVAVKIDLALEKNDLAALPDLISAGKKVLEPGAIAMLQLYAAGAFTFAGDDASAAQMLAGAEESLGPAKAEDQNWYMRLLIAGAKGDAPIAQVLAAARENTSIEHAWFVAAMRDRAHAADYLTRASQAASDLELPYLEAKAMAARLR